MQQQLNPEREQILKEQMKAYLGYLMMLSTEDIRLLLLKNVFTIADTNYADD